MEYKFQQRKLSTNTYEIVETVQGTIKGVKRSSVWGDYYISFEGIPYAKPPLGELRFKGPVAHENWQGVRDCTGPGSIPMQANVVFRKWKGSEDCLYLNVYTKNVSCVEIIINTIFILPEI